MSVAKAKEYLEPRGYGNKIDIHDEPCDTVQNAARIVGASEAEIAKTMSFLVDEQPIVIVTTGDTKIDNAKYKAFFHKKCKMVPWDDVQDIIGHEPGGVCAFGVNKNVKPYLDVQLKRFPIVHSAAGAPEATISLSPEELETLLAPVEWIDVCKPIVEEQA